MKNNLFMDFSIDQENHSIKVEREFAAELPKVFLVYTFKIRKEIAHKIK